MTFLRDVKFAFRSLARAKGLAFTVVLTMALGIGANAAIFTLVRGVLLRPLVNPDEDRLIYIRQSAPALGIENRTFSIPEIQDLRLRVKAVSPFGDFRPSALLRSAWASLASSARASSTDRISRSWARVRFSAVFSACATTAQTPPAPPR